MTKLLIIFTFHIGIILSVIFFNSINLYNEKIYAHPFSRSEAASFVARIYQMQIESELTLTNLEDDNVTLAQNHANKAASLLTPPIIFEIIEGNTQTATELATSLNNLRKVLSSSENQKQIISNLVSQINASLTKALDFRSLRPFSEKPSDSLENGVEVINGPFDSSGPGLDYCQASKNSLIQPLAFAEVVDRVLINYGNAYGVDFDMTNMSNMVMPVNTTIEVNKSSHSNMNMNSMDMSPFTATNDTNQINSNYSLANITDYQSAQALATKALEMFNSKLKHIALNNNYKSNQSTFVTNLEGGISQLNNSITNKASPLDIMMIVHTQIHPNLLEIFDLETRKI